MEEFLKWISQNTFSQVVSFTGAFASIASFVLTAITLFYAAFKQRKKLQKAEESRFFKVLKSDNITDLGIYLDDTLGQFTINEYTSSPEIAKRVDKYIEKIQEFVGTEEQISLTPSTEPPEESDLGYEDLPEQFKPIFEELRTGELWNALARLRRLIEMHLRNLAISLNFKEKHLKSAGQILRIIFDGKYIKPNSYEMLKYSIEVCNRAIHGIDISEEEAEQAIYSSVYALQHLESDNYHIDALSRAKRAIEIDPNNVRAWVNMSVALGKFGRHDDALSAAERAIEIDPNYAIARYNQACICSLKGYKEKAIDSLKKAIILDESCKKRAKDDERFKSLWDDPEFKKLTE